MHDDADFLAAVAANPQDQLTRLVYADWLDERNDPRGELVRIEEEVRFEPAWSEVLWSQKPRRNELRAKCDPAWLAAMRYGTDCLPLFYGRPFPDHWRDGWRLIREATERWLGYPMPDVGGHLFEDEYPWEHTEKRLGLTLPPSLREFRAYESDHPHGGTMIGWTGIGNATFRLGVWHEDNILTFGQSLRTECWYGCPLPELHSNPLKMHRFVVREGSDLDGSRRLHLGEQLHNFTWFVFAKVFLDACNMYRGRIQFTHDWSGCQAWLAGELPHFSPCGDGGIYEDLNRSALLLPRIGGVAVWSKTDPQGFTLPDTLCAQPDDQDFAVASERLEWQLGPTQSDTHESLQS